MPLSKQREEIEGKDSKITVKFLCTLAHLNSTYISWPRRVISGINGIEKYNPLPEKGTANIVNKKLCSTVHLPFMDIHFLSFYIYTHTFKRVA